MVPNDRRFESNRRRSEDEVLSPVNHKKKRVQIYCVLSHEEVVRVQLPHVRDTRVYLRTIFNFFSLVKKRGRAPTSSVIFLLRLVRWIKGFFLCILSIIPLVRLLLVAMSE